MRPLPPLHRYSDAIFQRRHEFASLRCPMLVLSRKRDEKIVIGNGIVVTIVEVRGDKVRLGIEAPQDVPVHRMEVYEAIQRANDQANANQE